MAGIAAMKLRSCLLLACMAIVPMVAMFSHKIPREWRAAAQRLARGEGLAAPPPRRVETVVEAPPPPTDAPDPAPPTSPVPTAPPAGEDLALVRASVEDKLQSLGAVSFECAPLASTGLHRCSCRMPADPSGQLQRVFQSSNPDPVVALRNLLGQVQFWKHRLASRPHSATLPHAAGDVGRTDLR